MIVLPILVATVEGSRVENIVSKRRKNKKNNKAKGKTKRITRNKTKISYQTIKED